MVVVATKRAKAMGMDVSEYIAHILNNKLKEPWNMPVPAEVKKSPSNCQNPS